MEYTEIRTLVVPGIYSIEFEGKVYIGLSKNVLKAFAEHIERIKKGSHDYIKCDAQNIETKLLEVESNSLNRKLKYNTWCEYYRNKGFTLVRDYTPIKFKVITRIKHSNSCKVVVELVATRNDKIVVGVFNKVSYAEEFVNKYYPNGEVKKVVYCGNKETREYRSQL